MSLNLVHRDGAISLFWSNNRELRQAQRQRALRPSQIFERFVRFSENNICDIELKRLKTK